ncbi:hypothetical protein ACLOJK_006195 [Asimina triloba]
MKSLFFPYANLAAHAILSAALAFIITTFRISFLFLYGLHTYIHPDNIAGADPAKSNVRAAIRRPDSSHDGPDPGKRRHRSKFDFDESKAQILRLRLADAQLRSRLYIADYRSAFLYSSLALANLTLQRFLPADSGILSSVPAALALCAAGRVAISLVKAAFERSASRKSEKQLSLLVGAVGFLLVLSIFSVLAPTAVDFEFASAGGLARVSIAILAAGIAACLYVPSSKVARSFWLGTDQLRWSLDVISCGAPARILLYLNFLMAVFTSLLWVNPVAEMLVKKDSDGEAEFRVNDKLEGNVGLLRSEFLQFRICCLLGSAVLQILCLRPNLQMFLNEAVLSWYQRLHSSRVPDLDFGRAKVFLHDYYLCLVSLQFFAVPALILLFLAFSQIPGSLFGGFIYLDIFVHYSSLLKEAALFLAWWVVFIWAAFISANLALYRYGIFLIS